MQGVANSNDEWVTIKRCLRPPQTHLLLHVQLFSRRYSLMMLAFVSSDSCSVSSEGLLRAACAAASRQHTTQSRHADVKFLTLALILAVPACVGCNRVCGVVQ